MSKPDLVSIYDCTVKDDKGSVSADFQIDRNTGELYFNGKQFSLVNLKLTIMQQSLVWLVPICTLTIALCTVYSTFFK